MEDRAQDGGCLCRSVAMGKQQSERLPPGATSGVPRSPEGGPKGLTRRCLILSCFNLLYRLRASLFLSLCLLHTVGPESHVWSALSRLQKQFPSRLPPLQVRMCLTDLLQRVNFVDIHCNLSRQEQIEEFVCVRLQLFPRDEVVEERRPHELDVLGPKFEKVDGRDRSRLGT